MRSYWTQVESQKQHFNSYTLVLGSLRVLVLPPKKVNRDNGFCWFNTDSSQKHSTCFTKLDQAKGADLSNLHSNNRHRTL